jgi:hypothetical protein
MDQCEGTEKHEHFSLYTGTYIEHQHPHDCRSLEFNKLHHHAPEDHHMFTEDELAHQERDTGRRLLSDAK